MADLSKIKLNGTVYDLKDSVARAALNKNYLEIIELGNFSMEDYDWEISNFASDLTDTGFYHAYETEDGFDYWFEVKNIGSVIQQSYFYGEEPDREYVRIGYNTTDPIEWRDWTVKMTYDYTDAVFARKNHIHYETVTINQNIRTYLNNSSVFGELANNEREKILYVINNSDNKTYYVLYSLMNTFNPRQIGQLYFSLSDPAHIYRRTGTRANATNTWSDWVDFTPGTSSGGNVEFITDLGIFSLNDYEDDFFNFLATITEPGFYTAEDNSDHFTYFIRVERAGNRVGTIWWSSEEGHQAVYMLDGVYNSTTKLIEWDTDNSYNYLTNTQAYQTFASKTHVHYKNVYAAQDATATTIESFINNASLNEGSYRVFTGDNKVWYVEFDMNYVTGTRRWENIQRYYETTNPNVVYVRTGHKEANSPRTWDEPVRYTPTTVTNTLADGALIATIGSTNIYAPDDVATTTTDGLMSAQDKRFLDSLNPNMEATLTNINSSEFQIINAKQSNALNMVLTAEPVIESQVRTINILDVNVFTAGYYISSNGQLQSNANDRVGDFIPVSPGDDIYYTGIIGPTNSGSINRRLHVYKADKTWIKQISFASNLKVGQNWSTHGVVPSNGAYIRVSWGVEDTNVMISVGAPDQYWPYYITPFGTISQATFAVGPTTDREDATEYSVTVPAAAGTQYGFSYNPILGKLYSSTGHIASYNGETLPGIWWSDRDTYAEGTTPSTGAEVIYKLADEDIVEYDFTPMTIPLGQYVNYFFVDGGQLKELSYYAQTLAVNHLTIKDGLSFGDTNILESDIMAWNNAAGIMDEKANIDSPVFTGNPMAPNASIGMNNARIANTIYVQTKMANLAPFEATTKASKNYDVGDYVYIAAHGKLFKVKAAVASGASFTVGTDIEETTIADELKELQAAIAAIQT